MRKIALWRYQIPMDAGVFLRERRLKQREGLLVRLTQGEKTGWGEIAPLPGFSEETVNQSERVVGGWLAAWKAGQQPALPLLPSVAFGLSCALAELEDALPESANYHTTPLCSGDPDALLIKLQKLPANKIAKIKVGLYEVIRDAMLVNLLLEAIPDLHLRLDANRSWPLSKALQFVSYLKPSLISRIDFIEEPCHDREQSRAFAHQTGLPIAWDESLREQDFILLAEPGLQAVIIKPTLTGSLSEVKRQISTAHKLGLIAVVSSSLESSLGLGQLARLASWLTPNIPHGLDTLSIMQAQLIRRWPGCPLPCWSEQRLTRKI